MKDGQVIRRVTHSDSCKQVWISSSQISARMASGTSMPPPVSVSTAVYSSLDNPEAITIDHAGVIGNGAGAADSADPGTNGAPGSNDATAPVAGSSLTDPMVSLQESQEFRPPRLELRQCSPFLIQRCLGQHAIELQDDLSCATFAASGKSSHRINACTKFRLP